MSRLTKIAIVAGIVLGLGALYSIASAQAPGAAPVAPVNPAVSSPAGVVPGGAGAGAVASATDTRPEAGLSGTTVALVSKMFQLLISLMDTFTWMLFYLLDTIMDPEWIFDLQANGSDGDLLNILREIWQFTRDIVNIFFALLLVAGAISMIVTADTSKVKEKLPKFVIALILVNFSWFIPRMIFDASQVFTYTVYQIPSLLNADGCSTVDPDATKLARKPCEIVTNVIFFPEETRKIGPDGVKSDDGSPGWRCPLFDPFSSLVCYQSVPINTPGVNPQPRSKILNGLIVNHARLATLTSVLDPRRPSGVGSINGPDGLSIALQGLSYAVKLIIVLLLHVALFFPLLAMTAAFLLRIPVLWITMAFMPLVAVGYVMGERLKDFNPMEIVLKQFLHAVFLPVKVAVPFVIGFIMVNAGSATPPPPLFDKLAPISLLSGVRDLWQMLWLIIALGIIWKYAFKALKSDDSIIGLFTDKIQDFGRTLGQIAYRAPLSLPIIPLPSKGGEQQFTSPLQLKNAYSLQNINADLATGNFGILDEGIKRRRGDLGDRNAKIDIVVKNFTSNVSKNAISDRINIVKNDKTDGTRAKEELKKALEELRKKQTKDTEGLTDRELVDALIKGLGITDEKEKERLKKVMESLEGGGANTK